MLKLLTTLLVGAVACVSTQALAERMTRDEYKAETERIAAEYKADSKACKSLKANARDACRKEAKAVMNRAKADATPTRKVSGVIRDAAQDKWDADFRQVMMHRA